MHPLLEWGLGFIRAVQAHRPEWLDPAVVALTALGSGVAYLLLLPAVAWCHDRRLGAELLLLFAATSALNSELKQLWSLPRPFVHAPELQLVFTRGYSLPSGHAQNAAALWGLIAFAAGRRRTRIAAAAALVAIGLSRVYLGVHYPTDVLLGWAIGLLLALALWRGRDRLWEWLARPTPHLAVAVAAGAVAVAALARRQAAAAAAGLVVGVVLGRVWEVHRRPPADVGGGLRERLFRYLAGVLVAAGVLALGRLGREQLPLVTVAYAAYALWVTWAAWWWLAVVARRAEGAAQRLAG